MPEFDYIIVGAGSAGGVLATRLSEDADLRVLLIEAGGRTDHWSIRMPAALASNFEGGPWNWCYYSVPQRHLAGRRIFQPRGKGLGGSSAINGMAYIRGHALDYQRWAEEGAAGWSYAEVLPYFRRSERHSRGEDPWRGGSGPLATVCYGMEDPLSRAFIEAGAAAGFPVTQDVNCYQQEGLGPFDRNIDRGERASTAQAFINPARSRPNLCIRTDTVVRKVLLEGRRARGVVCSSDGILSRAPLRCIPVEKRPAHRRRLRVARGRLDALVPCDCGSELLHRRGRWPVRRGPPTPPPCGRSLLPRPAA